MADEKVKQYRGSLHWLWLSLVVILIDQWIKYWAINTLTLNQPKIVTSFFNLTLVYNKGSAFGFLSEVGWPATWLFVAVAILVSVILIYWLYRIRHKPWLACALALILGGALGNLINRVVYGYVIDFLDFHVANLHWPAFNFADSTVFIGAVMILIDTILHHHVDETP